MAINQARKTAYLRAMGIDVWVDRDRPDIALSEPVAKADQSESATLSERNAESVRFETPPQPRTESSAPVLRNETDRIEAPAPEPVPAKPVANPPQNLSEDWDELQQRVQTCEQCKLSKTRTQTVFGVGAQAPSLMIVGEAPGADEDKKGEPFVGRAGQLLDEMLASIGYSRTSNVFIANVVKCRPPGNRDPELDEVESCRPYLDMQIRLLKPKLIVGLGRVAAQRLLASKEPLSRLRGPLHEYGAEKTPLFITYHPAYLLRSPREKAKSWADLKQVWRHLNPVPAA